MTRVLVVRVGLPPEVREIGGATLKVMQAIVGGYVECVDLGDGVDCWVNDEGRLLDLPVNALIPAVAPELPEGWEIFYAEPGLAGPGEPGIWELRGDLLLARHDGQGNTTSLTDEDVRTWTRRLWPRP